MMDSAPLEGCNFAVPIIITALSVFAMLVLGCATTPTGPTENTVDCKTFLETDHDDRLGQWVNTFRRALSSNPDLPSIFGRCILTLPRIESADIGLGRACQANPDLDFDVALKTQLEKQFQLCGLTFKTPTE